jgi:primosomal protein N' (replication factor Y)
VQVLDGVTGSGKTEVYFEAIAQTLRQGRQALVLMPEIALTAQFLDRFRARFGVRPAEWHSELTPRRRERTFRAVQAGEVRALVGARSALFLPYADLGLIVIDEEHDPAFKQEDGTRYHARDMAVVRAKEEGFPVVLASATPSIETMVNADRGRYRRLVLPGRFGAATLPPLAAIDLTKTPPARGRFLSPPLLDALRETLAAGRQSLVYLNRRGFAPLTLCNACGHRFRCTACDAWLVDHRFRRRLVCHHCGFSMPRPEACPACGATDELVPCGPGVERITDELHEMLPDARILTLSTDLVVGIDKLREELTAVERGDFDIVVGTQLVAKGHHFPRLDLVGVVDADLGLGQGDPRAAERTFQVLAQVVGRAGRAGVGGRGLIQTRTPDHPVLRALLENDRDGFYAAETAARAEAKLPPFGRLAIVLAAAPDKTDAEAHIREVLRVAPADPRVKVLGPAEPPMALVRGRHRMRLVIKAEREVDLSGYLARWLAAAPKPRGAVKREVDIDPWSFL